MKIEVYPCANGVLAQAECQEDSIILFDKYGHMALGYIELKDVGKVVAQLQKCKVCDHKELCDKCSDCICQSYLRKHQSEILVEDETNEAD